MSEIPGIPVKESAKADCKRNKQDDQGDLNHIPVTRPERIVIGVKHHKNDKSNRVNSQQPECVPIDPVQSSECF